MSQENIQLLFEAGRAAANRNWPNAQIVSIDQLDDQTPTGPPLVIAAESRGVATSTVKTLAALAGAGRHVLLVTDQPLPDDVASWLPADTVFVIGKEPASAPPVTTDRRTQLQHIILTRLAAHPDRAVRGYVAGNPRTPPDMLARLADDSEFTVRCSVANNSHTPAEVLTRLAARMQKSYLKPDHEKWVRGYVARNPHTPPDVLARLADDPDSDDEGISIGDQLEVLAGNPHTPPDVLTRLADYPNGWVRGSVAGNPHTPPDILARLADDSDYEWIYEKLAGNPHTPPDVLARIADDPEKDDPDGRVLPELAGNPHTPPDVLARLTADPNASELVRIAATGNPATRMTVLEQIAASLEAEHRQP